MVSVATDCRKVMAEAATLCAQTGRQAFSGDYALAERESDNEKVVSLLFQV